VALLYNSERCVTLDGSVQFTLGIRRGSPIKDIERAQSRQGQLSAAILDGPALGRILFPHMAQRTRDVISAGSRFVYYTTADTAARILGNRQVWMRSTTAMNDYLEVEHGFDCLNASYKAEPGKIFNSALDACFPGLAPELLELF
jgi:hypothetical protein